MPDQSQAVWITINGQDASEWYVGRSFRANLTTGSERDSFSFALHVDPDNFPATAGWPPFLPSQTDLKLNCEREVTIQDNLGNLIVRGRIKRLGIQTKVPALSGSGYVNVFEVSCQGLEKDLDDTFFSEFWENKSTGWIARDVAQRFCPSWLDTAGIVVDSPPCRVLKAYEALNRKPSQVLDQLAAMQGWQWYLDKDKVLHFAPPGAAQAAVWLTDDAAKIAAPSAAEPWKDVAFIAGRTLTVEPDSANLATVVTLLYQTRYSTGTVNLSSTLKTRVEGQGVAWMGYIPAEAVFRVEGFEGAYPINEISQAGGMQLLTLGQPLADDVFTKLGNEPSGLTYEISQIPAGIEVADHQAIASLASIRGDTSADAGRIERPIDSQGHYSIEEARDRALAELTPVANPLVNISFRTNNEALGGAIRPGEYVRFAFTERYTLDETLAVKAVGVEDRGGVMADGRALLDYAVSLETRLYSFALLVRKYEESADFAVNLKDPKRLAQLRSAAERVRPAETVAGGSATEVFAPAQWGPGTEKIVDTIADWNAGTHLGTEAVTDQGAAVLRLAYLAAGSPTKTTNNTRCFLVSIAGQDPAATGGDLDLQVKGPASASKPTNNTHTTLTGSAYAAWGVSSGQLVATYFPGPGQWEFRWGQQVQIVSGWQAGTVLSFVDAGLGNISITLDASAPTWGGAGLQDIVNLSVSTVEGWRWKWGTGYSTEFTTWPGGQQPAIADGTGYLGTLTIRPDSEAATGNGRDAVSILAVPAFQTSGTWTSAPILILSPLGAKAFSWIRTVNTGQGATVSFRTLADQAGTIAGAWQTGADPQAVLRALTDWIGDGNGFSRIAKYVQVKIALAGPGSSTPTVDSFRLTDEAATAWDGALWGAPDARSFDLLAQWTETGSDFSSTALDALGGGSYQLGLSKPDGINFAASGTWMSGWRHAGTPYALKTATWTQVQPTGTSVAVEFSAAWNAAGDGASAWVADIRTLAEAPFYRVRVTLTTNSSAQTPSVSALAITPA